MVGQQTLNLFILVRIQARQHIKILWHQLEYFYILSYTGFEQGMGQRNALAVAKRYFIVNSFLITMESIKVSTTSELNKFFNNNRFYVNGKNIKVDHLHETTANSRWEYENLWGIYLTNTDHAWMGLWMAATSRGKVRKRQIRYISPKEDDFIGRIEIYNPDHLKLEDALCDEAYLYLFDLSKYEGIETLDLARNFNLLKDSFRKDEIEKRGVIQNYFLPNFEHRAVVIVDDWQIALINFKKIVPDIELILTKDLIKELSQKVTFTDIEIGQNYITHEQN